MSFRKFVAAAIVAGGALLGSVGVAIPAAAATACPAGSACIWEDGGYMTNGNTSQYTAFTMHIPNYALHTYRSTSISANDSASSVWNAGRYSTAYFYKNSHRSSLAATLLRNTGDGQLSNDAGLAPAGYNDSYSSGNFAGY